MKIARVSLPLIFARLIFSLTRDDMSRETQLRHLRIFSDKVNHSIPNLPFGFPNST